MALVTGRLRDFGLESMVDAQPRLRFLPSAVGVVGGDVFATRPAVTTVDADGDFVVDLQPTEGLQNIVHYTLTITWLNSAGTTVEIDFPDWRITVPVDGGEIGDLINAPVNPALTWVSETPPLNPQPGQLWLVPSTGDLNRWES